MRKVEMCNNILIVILKIKKYVIYVDFVRLK